MKICIDSPTSFVITEQNDKYFEKLTCQSSIGYITVHQEDCPEIIYQITNRILVFVRGSLSYRDNDPLRVKDPNHMPHILKALKEFCTFNNEPFEIESCIL